jgi:restriction system protein
MPSSTPVQIDYAALVIKPAFQGIINSTPMLINFFVSTWYVWLIFLFFIAVKLGYELYQYSKLKKSGIFEIDKMSGEEFEERLKILFTNLGYKAERTSGGKVKPDYGVDLIIQKDGIRTAVQAKCYKKESVGESAIQAVFAGKQWYYCTESMVVTNSKFTKMAWKLAKADNVKLWSRNYLVKVLLTEKEKSLQK